jgi:outer membrane protein assembly factor BamB
MMARLRWVRGLLALGALAPPLAAAAEPPPFNPSHAPGYAQTTWPVVHGDSGNSDYVPIASAGDVERSFHVLAGAALWTAPSVGPEGHVYIASGRGQGTSHLHVFSRDGTLLWEGPPQRNRDGLDSAAVISAPVIDADGDVYIGDSNQFWAFHADGRQKWVVDVRGFGVSAPFITGIIVRDFVGGVSADGKVMLLRRSDGALGVPVLDLPGAASPLGPPIPKGLWGGGLVDPEIRDMVWEILRGHRYEITNTPAVHPETGRIYVVGAGATEEEGSFYGIDLADGHLAVAFQTPVPPGSGTSPAISPDRSRLYAMARGALFAIDSESGAVLWSVDVNGQDASPSVAPDDTVYVLGGERLVAVDGERGAVEWSADYRAFAASQLPEVWTRFGLIATGEPTAFVDSVVTVTPDRLWTSILMGYELNFFGRRFTHAVKTMLVAVSPEDGRVLESHPIPDTSEGGISMSRTGDLYMDLLAAQASIAFYSGYQWLLPGELVVSEPRAGLVGFRPASQRRQVAAGIDWVVRLLANGAEERGEGSRLRLRRAFSQLGVSLDSLRLARSRGEVSESEARSVGDLLAEVAAAIRGCLEADPEAADSGGRSCSEASGYADALARARQQLL